MGLFDFLRRLFSPRSSPPVSRTSRPRKRHNKPRLVRLRRAGDSTTWQLNKTVRAEKCPYAFARLGVGTDRYLDLSLDGSDERLARHSFPIFRTPEQLAQWLELPLGRLAWLVHRYSEDARPQSERERTTIIAGSTSGWAAAG